jgi:hypothetical protein
MVPDRVQLHQVDYNEVVDLNQVREVIFKINCKTLKIVRTGYIFSCNVFGYSLETYPKNFSRGPPSRGSFYP